MMMKILHVAINQQRNMNGWLNVTKKKCMRQLDLAKETQGRVKKKCEINFLNEND